MVRMPEIVEKVIKEFANCIPSSEEETAKEIKSMVKEYGFSNVSTDIISYRLADVCCCWDYRTNGHFDPSKFTNGKRDKLMNELNEAYYLSERFVKLAKEGEKE